MPGAMTFAGPRDVLAFREALEALEPGRRHRIAFVASAGVAWTLPLYELALQTAEHGRRHGLDLHLEFVTREADPLDVFGPDASAAVARRLISSGVHLRTGDLRPGVRRRPAVAGARRPARGRPRRRAAAPVRPGARPGFPATPDGFVPSTRTAACATSTASGRSAT